MTTTPSPRISFATTDWSPERRDDGSHYPGGAGWARVVSVADALHDLGWQTSVGVLVGSPTGRIGVQTWAQAEESAAGGDKVWDEEADLVVLQRWMHYDVPERIALARSRGQVIVQDVDDDFWAIDPKNQAAAQTDPKKNPDENRDHYARSLAVSSAITVSTPALAERMAQIAPGVPCHVIENGVDRVAAGLDEVVPEKPVVGWAGGIPWRSGDLEILKGVLGPFVERHDLEVVHVGATDPSLGWPTFADLTGVDPDRVTDVPMVPHDAYLDEIRRISLGVIPLRDCRFNRAKSWIKGAEYAAAGIPFVASDLPEYRRLHDDLGIGRVARRPRDWVRHLEELVDPEARQIDRAIGIDVAGRRLTMEHRAGIWEDLYLDLLPG